MVIVGNIPLMSSKHLSCVATHLQISMQAHVPELVWDLQSESLFLRFLSIRVNNNIIGVPWWAPPLPRPITHSTCLQMTPRMLSSNGNEWTSRHMWGYLIPNATVSLCSLHYTHYNGHPQNFIQSTNRLLKNQPSCGVTGTNQNLSFLRRRLHGDFDKHLQRQQQMKLFAIRLKITNKFSNLQGYRSNHPCSGAAYKNTWPHMTKHDNLSTIL